MKKKLLVSFFSLVIAFVLLTSASFAWFTVSRAPEVTNVITHVEANKNLEIARASSTNGTAAILAPGEVRADSEFKETEFGGQVTDFGIATLTVPAKLIPQSGLTGVDSALNGKLTTVKYDNTGRTASYTSLTAPLTQPSGGQFNNITDGISYYYLATDTEKKAAVSYYVWLRTNAGGTNGTSTAPDDSVQGYANISATITDVMVARASETSVSGGSYTAVTAPSEDDYKLVLEASDATGEENKFRNADKYSIVMRVATYANLTSNKTAEVKAGNVITSVQSFQDLSNSTFKTANKVNTKTDAKGNTYSALTGDQDTVKYEFNNLITNCPRNSAILVEITVYLEGDQFYASDLGRDLYIKLGKITFSSDQIAEYDPNSAESIGAGDVSNPNKQLPEDQLHYGY